MKTCSCGCNAEPRWLCTGASPEGGFVDLPCCDLSADYLSSCCAEFDLPFKRHLIGGDGLGFAY
jgi:hypothetical protein